MRSPLPHQIPYRADIDGLRAFAVLSVLFFHAHPEQLPGGFVGVDIFFVISGFLISSLLLNSARQGTFSFVDFYSRRARRILPALILVLCAVFLAGALTLLPRDFSNLNELILSSVFFVPNFKLWTEAGYFAGNPNLRPLLHLWSLGVEEQFYLLWPLVVLIFWKRGMAWVIASLAATSFVTCVLFVAKHPNPVFYFPVTRLWELLAGAFLAWRERRHLHSMLGAATRLPVWMPNAFSLSGAALLLWGVFFINSSLPFPGWWTLLPVAGTMLIIAAGTQAKVNRLVLADPAIVFLGLISYPLYLWHWPILVFLRIFHHAEPSDVAKNIAMLAAILLAWLTYQFVERPIRNRKPGTARHGAALALLACSSILALVSGAVIALAGLPERYPASLQPFLTYDYEKNRYENTKCFLAEAQDPVAWKADACVEPQTDPAEPLIVLWGDSHAAHLRFGLDLLQRDRKFRIGQMTGSGCPPFVNVDLAFRPFCRSKNDNYLRQVIRLKPDMVVLSAAWYEQGTDDVRQTIRRLKDAGLRRIVVIGPVPLWQRPLPDLLIQNALAHDDRMQASFGPDMYLDVPDAHLKSLVEGEGALYISAMKALCPAGQCVTMTGYGPQYVVSFDNSHLTKPGSQLLMQRVADQLFAGIDVARR